MSFKPTAETLAIVAQLSGVWSGRHAMVRCPAHEDRTPSLSIRQGRSSILVHCFAGCDGREVMGAIRRLLGRPVADQVVIPEPANDRDAPYQRVWDTALPVAGTLGERYLRDVRGIRFLPPDVRFHPQCPMGRGLAARFLPALLVGVFRQGRLIAVQRQFLDASTARRTHRMMLGASRGGLWPARFTGTVIRIAEGFESACAYRQRTGQEAGTCFGVRNLSWFVAPQDATAICLLPDNDEEGWRFARAAAADRGTGGVPVAIEPCPSGYGDWAEITRPHVHMSAVS
ncbi:MAG: hypothetical protein KGL48_12300 [Sphingomonadales bacterium]|nr:hypothetical protein [Sphingomonadales bacterium]MDE2569609.1 hypothetical protein [Sphingomonadales bacterium]